MSASHLKRWLMVAAALVMCGAAARAAETAGEAAASSARAAEYVSTLFVFMLSTFVGLDVIRRVSRLLHTPLMSLTNAISAIAVVGSIIIAGEQHAPSTGYIFNILGLVAITASVTNIVSGFLITDRMLKMFKKREGNK